jgi:hypothetical protein
VSKLWAILSLFAACTLSAGCIAGTDQKANARPPSVDRANQNTDTARTNVEELGLLVNVPYEAEDVVWKEAPAGKKVTAVLLFSKATAERVVSDAQAYGPGQAVTVSPETWFPDELIAQSEMSGDAAVRGTAYPANAFFHDNYNSGRIIHVEGSDHFVLEVSAR